MTARLLWLPFVVLVILAGIAGYRLGQVPTESDLINHFAQQYVQERGDGARLIDCVGRGGNGPVRIALTCTHPDGDETVYLIGQRGGLVSAAGPAPSDEI